MRYYISAATSKGKLRGTNQDSFFCNGKYSINAEQNEMFCNAIVENDEPIVIAVFDGMGGLDKGEIAARIACESTNQFVWINGEPIERVIHLINRLICTVAAENKVKMGSTCVYLEYDQGRFRSLNLGDSKAYWLSDEKLTQLSYDHTEENSMKQIAASSDFDITVDMSARNSLTQHLGIPEEEFVLEPHISEWIQPSAGDIFLLCSDGLNEMLSDKEIKDICVEEAELSSKCKNLIESANKKGGKDNITVVLLGLFEA